MALEELLDWQALDWIEPWGDNREDYRFACLAAILVNALGIRRRDEKPWFAYHFIEDFRTAWVVPLATEKPIQPETPALMVPVQQREQTPEEIEGWIRLWIEGSNKVIEESGTSTRKIR